jgi:hypothetical protein
VGEYYAVCWCGHGAPGSGNWYLHGEYLSFPELWELWITSAGFKASGHLVLYMDSCYSATWSMYAEQEQLEMTIQAASSGPTDDGLFTTAYMKIIDKPHGHSSSASPLTPIIRSLSQPDDVKVTVDLNAPLLQDGRPIGEEKHSKRRYRWWIMLVVFLAAGALIWLFRFPPPASSPGRQVPPFTDPFNGTTTGTGSSLPPPFVSTGPSVLSAGLPLGTGFSTLIGTGSEQLDSTGPFEPTSDVFSRSASTGFSEPGMGITREMIAAQTEAISCWVGCSGSLKVGGYAFAYTAKPNLRFLWSCQVMETSTGTYASAKGLESCSGAVMHSICNWLNIEC